MRSPTARGASPTERGFNAHAANMGQWRQVADKLLSCSRNERGVVAQSGKIFRLLREMGDHAADHVDHGIAAAGKRYVQEARDFCSRQLSTFVFHCQQPARQVICRFRHRPIDDCVDMLFQTRGALGVSLAL